MDKIDAFDPLVKNYGGVLLGTVAVFDVLSSDTRIDAKSRKC